MGFHRHMVRQAFSGKAGIFRKEMYNLLASIPGVVTYLDDIFVTGATETEDLNSLEEVLKRLEKSGLRARKSMFIHGSFSFLFGAQD